MRKIDKFPTIYSDFEDNIEAFQQLRLEGEFPQLGEEMIPKTPIACIVLNGEKLNAFLPRSGRASVGLSPFLFNIVCTGRPASVK